MYSALCLSHQLGPSAQESLHGLGEQRPGAPPRLPDGGQVGEAGGQGAETELEQRKGAVTAASPHVTQLEDAAREAGGEDQAGREAALQCVALGGQIREVESWSGQRLPSLTSRK